MSGSQREEEEEVVLLRTFWVSEPIFGCATDFLSAHRRATKPDLPQHCHQAAAWSGVSLHSTSASTSQTPHLQDQPQLEMPLERSWGCEQIWGLRAGPLPPHRGLGTRHLPRVGPGTSP